jgi:hypothetical protein
MCSFGICIVQDPSPQKEIIEGDSLGEDAEYRRIQSGKAPNTGDLLGEGPEYRRVTGRKAPNTG